MHWQNVHLNKNSVCWGGTVDSCGKKFLDNSCYYVILRIGPGSPSAEYLGGLDDIDPTCFSCTVGSRSELDVSER